MGSLNYRAVFVVSFLKLNQLSLTNQPTPWITIRFNKLTVSQLVRYSLNFMEQPERSSPCLQIPAAGLSP